MTPNHKNTLIKMVKAIRLLSNFNFRVTSNGKNWVQCSTRARADEKFLESKHFQHISWYQGPRTQGIIR